MTAEISQAERALRIREITEKYDQDRQNRPASSLGYDAVNDNIRRGRVRLGIGSVVPQRRFPTSPRLSHS